MYGRSVFIDTGGERNPKTLQEDGDVHLVASAIEEKYGRSVCFDTGGERNPKTP